MNVFFAADTMQYVEVDLPSIQYDRWFTLGLDVLVSCTIIF